MADEFPTHRSRLQSAVILLASWVLFVGFYLLLAGQVEAAELSAGAIIAAATVGFILLCRRSKDRAFSFRAPSFQVPWGRLVCGVLAALVRDSVHVGRALLRALIERPAGTVGVVLRVPFRRGGEGPRAAARRGLVTLAASIAPNRYVLNLPDDEDVLRIHRLEPAPPAQDREWPV